MSVQYFTKGFCLIAIGLVPTFSAWAQTRPQAPSPSIALGQQAPAPTPTPKPKPTGFTPQNASLVLRWIDVRGNLFPGGKVQRMQWVWSRYKEDDLIDSPALRLWLTSRLPRDWVAKKVVGDGVTVIEPFKDGETQSMVIDLRTAASTMRFEFVDGKGNTNEMTLAIQVAVPRPYLLVRPECNKLDLKFVVHRAFARHLFVGLSCNDMADGFELFFFRSRDSKWNRETGLVDFDPDNVFNAFKYFVAKPKSQTVYSQRLFRVGTLDDQNRATEYSVYYNPKVRPQIFYFSAGLGTTYYSYAEELDNIKLTQLSLTGKVNAGARLIPRVLDIAFNGFMTILPIYHSPAELPFARFYGLNGRLGYRLPIGLGAVEFMFLGGWYFWGMLVNSSDDVGNFGIKALNGPQLFITMVNSQAGHAGWWAYLKLAMISDRLNITNLSNREIALGGGVELSARETKPFSITLDLAQAAYAKAATETQDANSMKLLSVTLGVQKAL